MSVLICGSFAYDTIMVFNDRFKNHILPDHVHILNVCFLVPEMRREFGGCAGNIAYNLKLLGGSPAPMGTVGGDFGPYTQWLDRCGIDAGRVTEIDGTYTAQAYITTDLDDNQIIAFHPGAMNHAHMNRERGLEGIELAIVAPDGRDAMLDHAKRFTEAGLPFVFDPGQGLPMFDGAELGRFIDQADYLTVNDYESQLLMEKTGLGIEDMAAELQAVVVTRGGEGSWIYTGGERLEIPPARISEPVDPTGCGDAYRAGLLFGISNGLSFDVTGRIASVVAAIKIEHHGTQNHSFDLDKVRSRYLQSYGSELVL